MTTIELVSMSRMSANEEDKWPVDHHRSMHHRYGPLLKQASCQRENLRDFEDIAVSVALQATVFRELSSTIWAGI